MGKKRRILTSNKFNGKLSTHPIFAKKEQPNGPVEAETVIETKQMQTVEKVNNVEVVPVIEANTPTAEETTSLTPQKTVKKTTVKKVATKKVNRKTPTRTAKKTKTNTKTAATIQ